MTVATKLKQVFTERFSDRPNILNDLLLIVDEVVTETEVPVGGYKSAKDLLQNMSIAFGIPVSRVVCGERKRMQVAFRQYFCYECKVMFKNRYTLAQIGDMLGQRDHTTIMYSINTARERIEAKDEVAIGLRDKWIKYNS